LALAEYKTAGAGGCHHVTVLLRTVNTECTAAAEADSASGQAATAHGS